MLLEMGLMPQFHYLQLIHIWGLQHTGALGAALDAAEAAVALAEKNGNPSHARALRSIAAWIRLDVFDYGGVVELSRHALPQMPDDELPSRRFCEAVMGAAEAGLSNSSRALEVLLPQRELAEERFSMRWYTRMLAARGLTEAYLRRNDPVNARKHARELLEMALATDERTWRARAYEAGARVSLAEGDLAQAQESIEQAITEMAGFEVPLADWEIHATAARIRRRLGDSYKAAEHRARSAATVRSLAASLESRPALHTQFLLHPAIREALGGGDGFSAST